jgi:cobalt-zinc-cadmium efflux system outer membrane protein
MRALSNLARSSPNLRALRVACCVFTGFVQPAAGGATVTGNSSAPAIPQQLSLAQAQQIALERNWDLLAAAAGVDAAAAQKIVVREFPNPSLALSTTKISADTHPNSTIEGNGAWQRSYDTVIAINQLFEIGGKRPNRRASAEAGYENASAQFFDAKRTLDLAVTRAYVVASLAEENLHVLDQSAATLRQEAALAQVRLQAGEISTADETQIAMTTAQFELDANSARSAATQARVALEVLLGNPTPTGEIALTDRLDDLAASATPPKLDRFASRRPDILAAEAVLRKAEADLRLQKSNRIPDPSLFVQYEHEPPDLPNSLGLGVSLPLPLWNRNRGNIRAAEVSREQARLALEKLRGQAAAEAVTALISYEDALRRWKDYRETILPKSEHVRKTVAYAYEKGGSSLLDLLLAERNDNQVRLAATQAASDMAIALATLKVATTEIPNSLRERQK